MKYLYSALLAGILVASSLSAQAQFTLDGRASAAEIGTGIGKYQLAGTYAGNHLDANRGLQALYVGYTATTLNIMVVASAEAADASTTFGYRGIVLYLNTPARNGLPAGLQLIGGSDGNSPLKHRPTLDMQADYGFRVSVGSAVAGANDVYFSAVSYVTGTTVAAGTDTYIGQGSKAGAVATASATAAILPGARYVYLNTATLAANTTSAGLEIEIPLAALGATPLAAGSRLDLLAAYTDTNGEFFSEIIPQISGRTTALGIDPDFTTIAGSQSVAFSLGAGVLATHTEEASALNFSIFPNPAAGVATVAYRVPAGTQPVSLAIYNTLGQLVRSVASGELQAGRQQLPLGTLAAGSYLVQLQVGSLLTSSKLLVQ